MRQFVIDTLENLDDVYYKLTGQGIFGRILTPVVYLVMLYAFVGETFSGTGNVLYIVVLLLGTVLLMSAYEQLPEEAKVPLVSFAALFAMGLIAVGAFLNSTGEVPSSVWMDFIWAGLLTGLITLAVISDVLSSFIWSPISNIKYRLYKQIHNETQQT